MLSSKQLQSRTSTRIHQAGLYCVALCCTQFCVKPDGSQLLNQEKATDKPLTSKCFGRARFPIALPIFLALRGGDLKRRCVGTTRRCKDAYLCRLRQDHSTRELCQNVDSMLHHLCRKVKPQYGATGCCRNTPGYIEPPSLYGLLPGDCCSESKKITAPPDDVTVPSFRKLRH